MRAAAQLGEAVARSDSSRKKGLALEDAAAKGSRQKRRIAGQLREKSMVKICLRTRGTRGVLKG